MSDDSRLESLLLQYEELQEAGTPATPEELCKDYPELLPALRRQIAALADMDARLQMAAEYRVRTKWGDRPEHEGYLTRFRLPADKLLQKLRQVDDQLRVDRSTLMHSPRGFPVLQDYDILREIGEGGMGVVYEARHRTSNRRVALKTIRNPEGDLLMHIKREFRSLVNLSHPGLVKFEELRTDGIQPFLTMELVEGVRFTDYVRDSYDSDADPNRTTHVNVPRLRNALRQLVGAIRYLHDSNRLHRDIKPSNVLVAAEGRVVVLDFGLCVEFQGDGSYRPPGGTIEYMAPELQQGKWPLSPASDWYSVGVMLFEALTGRRPFRENSFDELLQKKRSAPPSPRTVVADVPADLDALCVGLLDPDPAQRLRGLELFDRAIDQSASGVSRPPSEFWVGRQGKLAELFDALEMTKGGNPVTVIIRGRSGIGKTALVNRFLRDCRLHSSFIILRGKCYENDYLAFRGFDALIDSLARYLVRLPDQDVKEVRPDNVAALCRVFPVLTQVRVLNDARTASREFDAQEQRRRGFAALRELLRRLAWSRRLILFIDDLQWGSRDSAELFAAVFRGPDAPLCLSIMSARDEDEQSEFLEAIRAMRNSPDAAAWREITLDGLEEEDAVELAAQLLGIHHTSPVARDIARESEGHPLLLKFLAEDARSNSLDVPASRRETPQLEVAIRRRIDELPPSHRTLLDMLSVAGRSLDESLLARAAVEDDPAGTLGELRARSLVRTIDVGDRRHVDVYHDKIRETVLKQLAGRQIAERSNRLVAVLETADADPELLGRLCLQGNQAHRAGGYFLAAAQKAHSSLAFNDAIALYRLALTHLAPTGVHEVEIRRALADAFSQAGCGADSAREYLQAAQFAGNPESIRLRFRAALRYLTSGHVDPGMQSLRQALDASGIRFPSYTEALIRSVILHPLRVRLFGLSVQGQQPASVFERITLDAYWAAVAGLSAIDPIRAADFAGRNLLLSRRAGESTDVVRALTIYSGHVAARGWNHRKFVDQLLVATEQVARLDGRPYSLAVFSLARGLVAHLQSQYEDSVKYCDEAVKLMLDPQSQSTDEHCRDVSWEQTLARSFALWSLMYIGQIDELTRRQPALLRMAEEKDDLFASLNFGTQVRTCVLLGGDQPAAARQALEEDARRLPTLDFFVQHQNYFLAMATLEQYCGNGLPAWQHLEECRNRRRWSSVSFVEHMTIDYLQARCRAALAAACQARGPAQREMLREANRAEGRLRAKKTPWASAVATMLRAAIAAVQRSQNTRPLLTEAIRALEAVNGRLFAAAVNLRLAQIDQTGLSEATERLKQLGVTNPERMTEALLPGFEASWRRVG